MKPKSPWLCHCGKALKSQIDDKWPRRDRRSDGWIGDLRHQKQGQMSDHNPDPKANNVVRAIDIDADLGGPKNTSAYLADQLRQYARADKRNKRIKYIIHNGKIASSIMGWRWRKYSGIDGHWHHIHVSFNPTGDNDKTPFDIDLLKENQ